MALWLGQPRRRAGRDMNLETAQQPSQMSGRSRKAHAPICPACTRAARLSSGSEIYPHRADLAGVPVWICDGCGARVGCHPGTTKPLGTPANEQLRKARILLHERMIDPLWREGADAFYQEGDSAAKRRLRQVARARVYAFLAHRLGIKRKDCHTGLFDLDTCRRAWRALDGVSYSQVRTWTRLST